MKRCDETVAWAALKGHWEAHGRDLDLRQAFEADPQRFERWWLSAPGVMADLSRVRWDVATGRHLLALARECGIESWRDALLAGEPVNRTEGRAVLHTALRAPRGEGPFSEAVHAVLDAMLAYAESIRASAGGPVEGDIHDVVHIGIGGSDLGPRMAVAALEAWVHPRLRLHFVANVDGFELSRTLRTLNPRHTLFVVASKTFTTTETLANAHAAQQWFFDQGGTDVARHFVAVTTNVKAAAAFGIETTFPFWDWVGGRFSMWSAIGLPVALALGRKGFADLLAGAHAMDRHFATAPLEENLPVWLALMDVWNRNFHGWGNLCIAPYHQGLEFLPGYLQQLMMESNGKGVDAHGRALGFHTSAAVWGTPGTNGQHAFFQLLHQGTEVVPVEFLLVRRLTQRDDALWSPAFKQLMHEQHDMLLANGLAHARALMLGKSAAQALDEDVPTASPDLDRQELARHRTFPGNRPTITLVMDELTPETLGALVALYEHRTAVAGALWGINSFDQWGVELGKAMFKDLLPRLRSGDVDGLDAATAQLLDRLR